MLKIRAREIDLDVPPFVIAEIGVNHDGDPTRALQLVELAAEADADAVKFQLFRAEQLVSRAAGLAKYQEATEVSDPIALLKPLELDLDALPGLLAAAHQLDLAALVTVFSVEMVEEVRESELAIDGFKTASTDIINQPLIEALKALGLPMILSTGAAELEEIKRAHGWMGEHPHAFMQCVSAYPTPEDQAAIGGIAQIAGHCPVPVGYSDHTTATDSGGLAVATGAVILEKHLTDDCERPGPDHGASLDGAGFRSYVQHAHRAWRMRGGWAKVLQPIEEDVRVVSRQSLTWTQDVEAGRIVEREMLTIKRPGSGVPPFLLTDTIGRKTARPVEADWPVMAEDLD